VAGAERIEAAPAEVEQPDAGRGEGRQLEIAEHGGEVRPEPRDARAQRHDPFLEHAEVVVRHAHVEAPAAVPVHVGHARRGQVLPDAPEIGFRERRRAEVGAAVQDVGPEPSVDHLPEPGRAGAAVPPPERPGAQGLVPDPHPERAVVCDVNFRVLSGVDGRGGSPAPRRLHGHAKRRDLAFNVSVVWSSSPTSKMVGHPASTMRIDRMCSATGSGPPWWKACGIHVALPSEFAATR
jgi:hypothetical protein